MEMPGEQADNFFTVAFATDLLNEGHVTIPALLLRNYTKMGLTEAEVMLTLHLNYLRQLGEFLPDVERLGEMLSVGSAGARQLLESLKEKGMLVETDCFDQQRATTLKGYSLDGLFEALAEVWACERGGREAGQGKGEVAAGEEAHAELYGQFEKEFGRLLSPLEGSQIAEWLYKDGYPRELITESLKRAVLRGVLNFKYIDTILRDWAKNGVRSLREAALYEEKFSRARNGGRTQSANATERGKKPRKDKYRDLYWS